MAQEPSPQETLCKLAAVLLLLSGVGAPRAAAEDDPIPGMRRCAGDSDCASLKGPHRCLPQKYACGPASTCAARVCVPGPEPSSLGIVDVENSRERVGMETAVCSVSAKTADEERFIGDLWKRYAPIFDPGGWQNFGPDSSYRRITLVWGGKTLVLKSWHPLVEKAGKGVALSYGVVARDGRSLEDMLKGDEADYRGRRGAFDAITRACSARRKAR